MLPRKHVYAPCAGGTAGLRPAMTGTADAPPLNRPGLVGGALRLGARRPRG